MALIWNFFAVILGAAIVLITAHFVIRSSVRVAKKFRLSDELIGMTVLSIGTSIPEIMTHIVGSIKIVQQPVMMNELSGLLIGTNIGSDIFQQNFVLGLVGLVGVIVMQKKHILKDIGGLICATLLLFLFSYNGLISRLEGCILFFGYIAYLYLLKKRGMLGKESKISAKKNNSVAKHIIIVLISFAVMAVAADRMLQHSEILVQELHISASFFGIILLGIVAAFPELTTSLVAVYRKRVKISAGILVGSNITNPMFALGLGAIISTYTVPSVALWFDLPLKIATALLLLAFIYKGKMKKGSALTLIIIYLAYLVLRNYLFPADVFV